MNVSSQCVISFFPPTAVVSSHCRHKKPHRYWGRPGVCYLYKVIVITLELLFAYSHSGSEEGSVVCAKSGAETKEKEGPRCYFVKSIWKLGAVLE